MQTARSPVDRRRSGSIRAIVIASVYAAAAMVGHHLGLAIFGFVLIGAFGVFRAYSNSEWARIDGPEADERERDISVRAMALSHVIVVHVALAGAIFELAHGRYGPFGVICSVSGASQIAALWYVKRRR